LPGTRNDLRARSRRRHYRPHLAQHEQGTYYRLRINGRERVLENAIVGRHNVYNAMTAAGLALALGATFDAVVAGLLSVRNIPGRLPARTL